jgi:hypothetical protein
MMVRRYALGFPARQGLGFTVSAEMLTAITDVAKIAVETAPAIVTSVSDAARKKAAAKRKKAKKKKAATEAPVEAPTPVVQKPAVPAWAWPAGALAVVLTAALLLKPAVAPQVAASVAASEPVVKKNPKKNRKR